MQRFADIVLSMMALILLSPFLLPLLLILRLTGEGEIFYLQVRCGRNGLRFQVLKFATMLKNSPQIMTGSLTIDNDPRVLPVGKFLRKTKINELPQLWNVLRGDMSIIGPRPLTPEVFLAYSHEVQDQLNRLRPGISGIGSVVFRDEEGVLGNQDSPQEFYRTVIAPFKARLEIWYYQNANFIIYAGLIFLTMWVVVYPRSQLVWRWFPDLPQPPEELRRYWEKT